MKKLLRRVLKVMAIHKYMLAFGVTGLFIALREFVGSRRILTVACKYTEHPLQFRLNSSDLPVLFSIFQSKEYEIDLVKPPRVIVDAGANVGYSAIYFAQRYPQANIYAVEPEPANFRLLQKNTSSYRNIIPIEAALWNSNGPVQLFDRGTGSWGFAVLDRLPLPETSRSEVNGITMESLMTKHSISYIDILKIDIEGSEKEVFENSHAWLARVGNIMAELHERIKPGCEAAFAEATADFDVVTSRAMTMLALRESK